MTEIETKGTESSGSAQAPEQAAAERVDETSTSSSGARAPDEDAPVPADGGGASAGAVQGASGGADDDDGTQEIRGDLDALVKKAAQRDEYLALAQRTQADFENFRKRVARDAAAAQDRGMVTLAKELLPALDNLDRAIEAAEEDDPLLQGVRLVRKELSAALARCCIESFAPVGEVFDPTLHEAVATAPAPGDGGAPSGSVVEVYQAGYRLGETIIRPARVVVAA